MRNFMYGVGQVAAYFLLILLGVVAIIGLGWALGWAISVRESEPPSTSGVCTSTLCQ